jgi:hypothetical protein
MAIYERERREKGMTVVTGLVFTVAIHAALIAGAVLLHTKAEAEPEPGFKNIIEAKLVRLGTPLPEGALPRLVAAPPPPPDPGVQVTTKETPIPESQRPKEKPRPRRDENLEDELLKKMRRDSAPGPASGRRVGEGGTSGGDPRGDPEGEVLSAKDQIEGNLWAAQVKRELHRSWAIPELIPDGDLQRLSAIVVVQIDEQGNIKSFKFKTRASGGSFAGLFNGSVNQVFNKVRSLPAPPPGAFKVFKNGWLALRFTKVEAEKAK